MSLVVELSEVHRSFTDGRRHVDVLKSVNLKVLPGEFVVIVGPSGAGKSSILNIVSGLDIRFDGSAHVLGHSVKDLSDDARSKLRNEELGFVFQSFHLLPQLNVLENVCVPKWLSSRSIDVAQVEQKAKEALDKLGLLEHRLTNIGVLSGGERQRVAIARAMINDPQLILADEPTGNLDREIGAGIVDYFEALRADGQRAVLVVTHDERVSERADRVLHLEAGVLQ